MKPIFFLLLILVASSILHAQDKGFGIGVVLGEPTGISGKGWVSEKNAIGGGLAWSFRRTGSIHVHADYLWHFLHAIHSPSRFVPYAGPGVRIGGGRGGGVFGIRIVGGIGFWPPDSPLDIFAELAPIVDLAPATELSFNGGIGIRFFFK